MSSNDPFSGNTQNPYSFSDTPQVQISPEMQRGLVHHVMALSILTIVQGSLVTLYGVGMIGLAFVMPALIQAQGRIPVAPMPVAPAPVELAPEEPTPVAPVPAAPLPVTAMPAGFEWIMLAVYGSMGLIFLVVGVLGIWAGIRMLKFRGRTLGIVALSSGLLSMFGCYCLPTAIGLFIYGLIVLLNEPVKRAFAMGEQGRTASEIQNQFARLPG